MARKPESTAAALAAAALSLLPLTATATEWGAEVGVGGAYSSNVDRTPELGSATMEFARVGGSLRHNTRTLTIDGDFNAIFRTYSEANSSSDFLPQLRLDMLWNPLPGRFAWELRDNLGQVAQNARNGLRPVDRENANVLSTGPIFGLPLGESNRVVLSGLYTDLYYSQTPLSSKRYTGRLSFDHELPSGSVISLSGVSNRTEFKDQGGGGYDLQGVYLGYAGVGRRTVLTAQVGAESLHDFGETNNGAYVNLILDRRISARSDLLLQVLERYADAAEVFTLDQTLDPELGNVNDLQRVSDPIRQRQVQATWTTRYQRLTANLDGRYFSEKVQSTDGRDRKINEVGTNLTWRLNARDNLYGSAYLSRERFLSGAGESADDLNLLVGASRRFRADFELRGKVEYFSRSADLLDYKETRVTLELVWIPKAMAGDSENYFRRQRDRSIGRPARNTPQFQRPAAH